jgi:uncharacterized coiled-coil protein SlyX
MGKMELYRRLAALERRVNKLEAGMQEIDRVVDPQVWIGEAFHGLAEHIDRKFDAVESKVAEINVKLDTILRHQASVDHPEN